MRKGVLYGIAAALPFMKEQKSGHFVNVSGDLDDGDVSHRHPLDGLAVEWMEKVGDEEDLSGSGAEQ
jgi:hypothetical protein